jgi:hypothetical protein
VKVGFDDDTALGELVVGDRLEHGIDGVERLRDALAAAARGERLLDARLAGGQKTTRRLARVLTRKRGEARQHGGRDRGRERVAPPGRPRRIGRDQRVRQRFGLREPIGHDAAEEIVGARDTELGGFVHDERLLGNEEQAPAILKGRIPDPAEITIGELGEHESDRGLRGRFVLRQRVAIGRSKPYDGPRHATSGSNADATYLSAVIRSMA